MSLKSKNMRVLASFLAVNALCHLLVVGMMATREDAATLSNWTHGVAATALSTICAFVFSDIVDDVTKARIVFWRWRNPLPGSFAFSRYMHEDDRIDPARINSKHAPLPSDPAEQNRRWYNAVFKPHRDKPSVEQANARYLLLRDMAAISAVLMLGLGPATIVLSSKKMELVVGYAICLIAQHVMIAAAAANAGVRLVKNALAEDSD